MLMAVVFSRESRRDFAVCGRAATIKMILIPKDNSASA